MKKNKFTEFFKGKGYFVLLFVGVVAIAAVALVGSQFTTTKNSGEQKSVDLNDTDNNIAAKNDNNQLAENNPVSEKIANNASDTANGTAANNATASNTTKGNSTANSTTANKTAKDNTAAKDVASNDVEYEDYSANAGTTAQAADDSQKTDVSVATAGNNVAPDNKAAVDALSFKAEDGLQWPVKGNVIMNFSMDHTIYFATLMQYKCNPAIIIDAKVGTDVKASADGIVTGIDKNNDETGYTVTMDIGNGFKTVYGQLNKDSVTLKMGDSVKKGDVIGSVAEPSKYYTVEGSNLYFEVTENDQAVNPMLYLH